VQIHDFTVKSCCKALDTLDNVNDTYSNQLRMQAMYAQAAYMMQHPKAKSEAEMQAAGLSGTLRAYQAIQRFDRPLNTPNWMVICSPRKQGNSNTSSNTTCRYN
jgi:hypothetical protein